VIRQSFGHGGYALLIGRLRGRCGNKSSTTLAAMPALPAGWVPLWPALRRRFPGRRDARRSSARAVPRGRARDHDLHGGAAAVRGRQRKTLFLQFRNLCSWRLKVRPRGSRQHHHGAFRR